jgi:hypothetical protein
MVPTPIGPAWHLRTWILHVSHIKHLLKPANSHMQSNASGEFLFRPE